MVIPRVRENEVLSVAETIEEAEQRIRDLVASGKSLKEAREKMRYHRLQSKEK